VYPKGHPREGQQIDYGDVFVSDPAAVWHLPPGAEMWESGAIDLRPLVEATRSDVQDLAAATRTPLHMMAPAGDNQSAEGASLQREGLTFKAYDRINRTSPRWVDVVSLMLLHGGATDRRALARLEPIWAPPELLSLAERADAASKAANDIPLRSRLQLIWHFDPDAVDRMMTEWVDERLLQQQVANVLAAGPPAPALSAGASGVSAASPLGGGGRPRELVGAVPASGGGL